MCSLVTCMRSNSYVTMTNMLRGRRACIRDGHGRGDIVVALTSELPPTNMFLTHMLAVDSYVGSFDEGLLRRVACLL